MGYRQAILACVLAGGLGVPPSVHGDDLAELQETFAQLVQALSTQDLEGLAALWHDHLVTFQPFAQLATEGKAAHRQDFGELFEESESIRGAPLHVQYQVIDNIGIVWGHLAMMVQPKDGPVRTAILRSTFTFMKVNGKWVELVVHHSLVPPGD